jgi:hypothetical protein
MMPAERLEHEGIRIVAARDVMPNHFWVGVGKIGGKKKMRGATTQ